MRQSRLMSLVEAVANVVVGYALAVWAQGLVFPLFGLEATLRQSLGIGAIFTLVSLVRGYLLRRVSRRCGSRRLASGSHAALKAIRTDRNPNDLQEATPALTASP